MQKNKLPLIIVCDDKDMVYANYLIQLIGQKVILSILVYTFFSRMFDLCCLQ